ncbi:MAG: acetate--CoA ligase family protein [Actinomycetota bacterium]
MNPKALRPLLAPRSIAIVGASESPDSWAPEIHSSLGHLGYSGKLIPINPKYDEVWGLPCLSSTADLPKGVDLVVVVVPARVAVRAVADAGRTRARSAMVVSSGFAEAGDEGRRLQSELAAVAKKHRMPVLGPNVEGFVNYVDRVAVYGTTPPPEPVAGDITVISQSGTVAWTMSQMASDRGLGLRLILGVGNEAVLGLGDLYEWAAADPHTKVVATYMETLRDVDGIARGLRALRDAGKPILVCAPAGRSEAARRSIVAHTGALAGDTGVRDAWLRSMGAILADDPVEMFEGSVLFDFHRRVRRPGISAALQSGGACTLFAEAVGARGLELPEFSAATARKLRRALPEFANLNNPLDVTGQAAVETEMFEAALEALATDPSIGFVAFDAVPPRGDDENAVWAEPVLATARRLHKDTGVVFASVAMSPLAYTKAAKDFVDRAGLPFIQGHRASAGAIRALVELGGVKARAVRDVAPHPNRAKALALLRGSGGPLDEVRAGRILELYGVRRTRQKLVRSPAQAAAAAGNLGFPVAVKAAAAELPHKAKLGGVALGLKKRDEVEEAAGRVLRAATRAGARSPKVLVQKMSEGVEVLVGAVVDEQFGAAVTIRPGGALAEAGEGMFVAAPLSPKQALAFVESQALDCRLDSKRHDVGAVARAVRAVAHAARDLGPRLASLEANPLIVSKTGAVAVDALAEARRS